MNPWKLAVWAALSFILAALVCFVCALLVSCAMPTIQVDCWNKPHDEPLVIDACHGKQLHATWGF